MSATKTVAYGLGKLLSNRLCDLRKSPYVVKDSSDFVKKIKSSKNTNKLMVLFDVVSLFTKIPLHYTIKLILDEMYPECDNQCIQKREEEKKKTVKTKILYEWHRYVDDTFTLIEPTVDIEDILNVLNNFHESIKFTCENAFLGN
jgi:hypothetical protein